MKTCIKCREQKSLDDFFNTQYGKSRQCRECRYGAGSKREVARLKLLSSGKKACTICKEAFDFSKFHKRNDTKDGYQPQCKDCRRKYVIENFERISTKQKEDYNPEYRRQYYLDNIDRHKELSRKWIENNTDYIREYRKRHYLENTEYHTNKNRRWRNENPERASEIWHNYRARKQNAWDEDVHIKDVLSLHGDTCLFPGCGVKYDHLDHVVPLIMGGRHALNNIQPLCKSHNSQKGGKYADFRSPPAPMSENMFWHLFLNNKIWIP